jgi:hypothetical protein
MIKHNLKSQNNDKKRTILGRDVNSHKLVA